MTITVNPDDLTLDEHSEIHSALAELRRARRMPTSSPDYWHDLIQAATRYDLLLCAARLRIDADAQRAHVESLPELSDEQRARIDARMAERRARMSSERGAR